MSASGTSNFGVPLTEEQIINYRQIIESNALYPIILIFLPFEFLCQIYDVPEIDFEPLPLPPNSTS